MMRFREFLQTLREEGVAANCAGGGAIAGIGVGPTGEPGVDVKKRKRVGHEKAGRKVVDKVGFR